MDVYTVLHSVTETLSEYLQMQAATPRGLSVGYRTRMLSGLNPLMEQLHDWVLGQTDDGTEIGCSFDQQESEYSRGVWLLRDALMMAGYHTADVRVGGWGEVSFCVVGQFDEKWLTRLMHQLNAAKRCLHTSIANEWEQWAPRGDWYAVICEAFGGKSEPWCRGKLKGWIASGVAEVDAEAPERGDIRFRMDWVKDNKITPPERKTVSGNN